MTTQPVRLTLASKSRVRQRLLAATGLSFEAVDSGVDEDQAKAELHAHHTDPYGVAGALAERKALAVSIARPGLVIGADQTLEFEGALYDKAPSVAAARERLLSLRGRSHQLHAGLAVAEGGQVLWRRTETAALTMRGFSDAFLEGYLERNAGAALSSVGCYELEGEGAQLFEKIEGDYFAILGLPLLPLLAFLRERGAAPA